MSEQPIFLVGFMGCGKTTVGLELASLLGRSFVDLDLLIEARQQSSISQIFQEQGESYFRQIEGELLREAVTHQNSVIATGGGTFVDPTNRSLMLNSGIVIYLDCSFPVLLSRIAGDGARPLSRTAEQLKRLYEGRLEAYGTAQIKIDATGSTVAECVSRIVSELKD